MDSSAVPSCFVSSDRRLPGKRPVLLIHGLGRLTNGRQSGVARGVLECSRVIDKPRKHWGSGVPLPRVDSLVPATNQEVARSSCWAHQIDNLQPLFLVPDELGTIRAR
jgi:hypothetical protein